MLDQIQTYPTLKPAEVRTLRTRKEQRVERSILIVQTPFGGRRVAELFRPEGDGPFPVVLFVHWYEPFAPTSNRSQFVDEAIELASHGVMSLTIETLWSDDDFFLKRTQADDMENSKQEVVNLRRAMDFLLAQPGADPKRFAYVGHDFGGMYGILAGSLDRRPTHYVIMAATPRFADWYLYLPALEGNAREDFIRQMSALDPITHVPNLSPAPLLFQFADDDFHVPQERAQEFFAAAREPKEMKMYSCGHGLNEAASKERVEWLKARLGLK
jgi:dienelactone hydrolase